MNKSDILNEYYENQSDITVNNILATSRKVKIPKNIMQTWKTKTLPRKWKASQNAILKYMPDWKYTLMTDKDNLKFVKHYFPDFMFYFDSFEYPIQRADAIRYMWFYVKGGIYLDLDLKINKPLDDLFYENHDIYVVKSAIVDNVYTNAFVAAKARLSVMLQCLEEMSRPYASWHIGKHLKVVNSTGPNMFTRAIIKTKQEHNIDMKVKELPSDLIIACSICDPKPCCAENGYCTTLGGSSWTGFDTEFLTFVYCNRYIIAIILLVVIIICLVSVFWYFKRKRDNINCQ